MDQYRHFNPNTNAANNRVYINRNFNRNGLDGVSTLSNANVMYFNPNFTHIANSQQDIFIQRDHTTRPKIHVNPNFIRPKEQNVSVQNSSQLNICLSRPPKTSTQIMYPPQIQVAMVNQNHTQMPTLSKSRYCLIRQNEKVDKTPLVKPLPSNNTLQTVKLNKYKLVSLNSVKKSLTTDKSSTAKAIPLTQLKPNQANIFRTKYRISTKSTSNNSQNTRFKYVKKNTTLLRTSEPTQGIVRRVSITHSKSIQRTSFRQSKKIIAGTLKKNNIPCPLFKKYGKCLRMTRGSCEFLHDKKHVSICRKFLKGACHDKACLLSHDLTDKKMPTCYFYLQGMCTKEGCPYLHVKLNEKAKICPDFLKGYCEKGDKCVLRHFNVGSKNARKSVKIRKCSSSRTNKSLHIERTKNRRKNSGNEEENTTRKVDSRCNTEKEPTMDQRYFRDVASDTAVEEQCDLIKPTRCKLGTLPSFIQL